MLKVLFRSDAFKEIGTGHLARCLTLADCLKDKKHGVSFIVNKKSKECIKKLGKLNHKFLYHNYNIGSNSDANLTIKIAKKYSIKWVVLDGYNFSTTYQENLKGGGLKILILDDYAHLKKYYCDALLNQNISAKKELYKGTSAKFLLGSDYFILRDEFFKSGKKKRKISNTPNKILITMGGSDLNNVSSKILTFLNAYKEKKLEIIIIAGSINPHINKLNKLAKRSFHDVKVIENCKNMPSLISWADIGITSGGTTSYEIAYMGLPSLMVSLAKNQILNVEELSRKQSTINLGFYTSLKKDEFINQFKKLLFSKEGRAKMSLRAKNLVDGLGKERIIRELNSKNLILKSATLKDSKLLWKWRNDLLVRRNSFSSKLIKWNEHVSWFKNHFNDKNSFIYIAYTNGIPIGVVRFKLNNNNLKISFSICKEFRKKGLSKEMLNSAIDKVIKLSKIKTIQAFVKRKNSVSLALLNRIGFKSKSINTKENSICLELNKE